MMTGTLSTSPGQWPTHTSVSGLTLMRREETYAVPLPGAGKTLRPTNSPGSWLNQEVILGQYRRDPGVGFRYTEDTTSITWITLAFTLLRLRDLSGSYVPRRGAGKSLNRISELGWTRATARKIRESLSSFKEDWNSPGMDAYDKY